MDAVKELPHNDDQEDESFLNKLVESSGDVVLPDDFWDEFYTEVGNTGDIHDNHKLLEQLT